MSYGNFKEKKFKEARERGHKAYFSKANPGKLFVNGKYVAPDQPFVAPDQPSVSILLRTFEFPLQPHTGQI